VCSSDLMPFAAHLRFACSLQKACLCRIFLEEEVVFRLS